MRTLAGSITILWALSACSPPPMVVPPDVKDPTVTQVDGALVEGTAVARSPLTMSGTPLSLAPLSGEIAVVTADSVLALSATSGMLEAIPVGGPGEEMSTGAVRFAWRRGADGLWVVGANGLFHLADGRLLRSPLSDDLGTLTVQAIDGWDEGVNEEVWLTTSSGIQHVKGQLMETVEVQFPKLGALGNPSLAIAAGPGQAVVIAKQQAFLVDLTLATATWIARDIGDLKAWTRTDDGTVMLATTTGLYERAKTGDVTRRTLAAAGGAVVVATDVASGLGGVLISAGGKVARLDSGAYQTFGDLAAPSPRGLQLDANGDTWALDGAEMIKLATGKVTSFATEVKPFLTAHCNTCHFAGTQGSPVINFADYATAKSYGPLAVRRLKAEGIAPMPPANTEVLAAADYAVVLKWVAGGMQP